MPGYLDPQHLADLAKDLNLTAQEVEAFVTANSTVRAFLDQAVNTSQ